MQSPSPRELAIFQAVEAALAMATRKRYEMEIDAHIEIEDTYYHNPIYPKDEAYVVGHVQPVYLRKIRRYSINSLSIDAKRKEQE